MGRFFAPKVSNDTGVRAASADVSCGPAPRRETSGVARWPGQVLGRIAGCGFCGLRPRSGARGPPARHVGVRGPRLERLTLGPVGVFPSRSSSSTFERFRKLVELSRALHEGATPATSGHGGWPQGQRALVPIVGRARLRAGWPGGGHPRPSRHRRAVRDCRGPRPPTTTRLRPTCARAGLFRKPPPFRLRPGSRRGAAAQARELLGPRTGTDRPELSASVFSRGGRPRGTVTQPFSHWGGIL